MQLSRQYVQQPYLERFREELPDYTALIAERERVAGALDRRSVEVFKKPIDAVRPRKGAAFDPSGDAVCFGPGERLPDEEKRCLQTALEALIPWRKGPFDYFGTKVDAEWRSERKWRHVLEGAGLDLFRKKVLDVGCNNLYYMYRMLDLQPELVVGVDPMVRYYFHDLLNRKFGDFPQLDFELMGIESCGLFEGFFDAVFLMGILHHRRSPLDTLTTAASALRKGGTLVIESAGIPGEDSVCLFPESRYMKAPGYWFLPTESALKNMLRRAGLVDVQAFCSYRLDTSEQRRTDWARFESLEDFLDPKDPLKTVEGYPAPMRFYLTARKK